MTHPLAIDMLDLVEAVPPESRKTLAHIACCEPCRLMLVNIIQSGTDYPDLFATPDPDARGASLFLALFVPGACPATDEPDEVADRLVASLNVPGTKRIDGVMVGGIPSPQWLTPETLANLRRAASPSEKGER